MDINAKYWLTIMLLFLAGGFGYLVWDKYITPSNVDEYMEFEKRYIEAMTADTYGGKTPEETLNLFIDALKKEDADLAAKYFILDDNLSRDKWVKALNEMKSQGVLDDMARDLDDAKLGNLSNEETAGFVLLDESGIVETQVDMRFNIFSKIWKIEDL